MAAGNSLEVRASQPHLFLWESSQFAGLMPCAAFPDDQPAGEFNTDIFIPVFIFPVHKKGYSEMSHLLFGNIYGGEQRRRFL